MTIIAAADGSALGNPGPAGWAWYIDDDTWAAGGWEKSTNNRGELQSVLHLLLSTAHVPDDLVICCDSQYVIKSLTQWMPGWKRQGWRKKDKSTPKNVDLLKQLDAALHDRRGAVDFRWVKGHAGHPLNEAADERARAAATAFSRGKKPETGPGFPGAGEVVEADTATASASAAPAPSGPAAPSQEGLFELPTQGEEDELALREKNWLRSGRAPRRKDFVLIGEEPRRLSPSSLDVQIPREGVAIIRSQTSEPALRSSVWIAERGRWELAQHQVSPLAEG
ncbi:ribonuclease HI [Corynebacterium uropygiale]|uniref:ribonuclease H n=1 Tax=Corynebacterium uropygiale TaxID=1775911 RepID=A0A9X1QRK1_9CORY|nr:ribonuclease H [Corynebacterium uropygiale]MCF4006880.1 ribonuclease HI [Corynebacterium uropygiale]